MKKYILIFALSLLIISSCTFEKAALPEIVIECKSDTVVHYATNVSPIILTNCMPPHGSSGCHESGSVNGDYEIYSVIKTKVDNGTLYNSVVKLRTMPSGATLPDSTINIINCWIQQGGQNN